MIEFEKYISPELMKRSVSLESIGCHQIGWSKADTLLVLEALRANGVSILGGDVCKIYNNEITHTEDNWYYNRGPGESLSEYISQSHNITKEYIMKYCEPDDDEIIYVITAEKIYI